MPSRKLPCTAPAVCRSMVELTFGRDAGMLAAREDKPVASHLEGLLQQRARLVRPRSRIGQQLSRGDAIWPRTAEIHGAGFENLPPIFSSPARKSAISSS